jgi:hypothetical protein
VPGSKTRIPDAAATDSAGVVVMGNRRELPYALASIEAPGSELAASEFVQDASVLKVAAGLGAARVDAGLPELLKKVDCCVDGVAGARSGVERDAALEVVESDLDMGGDVM